VTVKVWRPDGVLAWTNRAQGRIGKHFEEEGELEEALHGETAGSIGGLDEDENAVERSLGFNHLLEVYAPVLGSDGETVLGAYEIYADPEQASPRGATSSGARSPSSSLFCGPRWRCSFAEPRARSERKPAS